MQAPEIPAHFELVRATDPAQLLGSVIGDVDLAAICDFPILDTPRSQGVGAAEYDARHGVGVPVIPGKPNFDAAPFW